MLFKKKKKKKKKLAHQLTVGLRTQLCKECTDLQRRLCEVDGRSALFHRWIEEDRALLRFDSYRPIAAEKAIIHRFHDRGVVEPGCSVDVVRETFALVEYRDGTIAKVDPLLVRFVTE